MRAAAPYSPLSEGSRSGRRGTHTCATAAVELAAEERVVELEVGAQAALRFGGKALLAIDRRVVEVEDAGEEAVVAPLQVEIVPDLHQLRDDAALAVVEVAVVLVGRSR